MKHGLAPANQGGFSLIELLVATSVLVIGLSAVLMTIRKGDELNVTDQHRRTAAAIIARTFESATYHHTNYPNLSTGTRTETVVVDPRGEGPDDDLTGSLRITVGAQQTLTGSSSVSVPYRTVTMRLLWNEVEGPTSLTLTKWLAMAQ